MGSDGDPVGTAAVDAFSGAAGEPTGEAGLATGELEVVTIGGGVTGAGGVGGGTRKLHRKSIAVEIRSAIMSRFCCIYLRGRLDIGL